MSNAANENVATGDKKRHLTTTTTKFQVKFLNLGMTTPLWVNPSKTFYKFLFIVTLIMSLLFVGSYIAIQYYNNTLTGLNSTVDSSNTSDEQNNKACVNKAYSYMKSWFIVIGSIILFINCKVWLISSNV